MISDPHVLCSFREPVLNGLHFAHQQTVDSSHCSPFNQKIISLQTQIWLLIMFTFTYEERRARELINYN